MSLIQALLDSPQLFHRVGALLALSEAFQDFSLLPRCAIDLQLLQARLFGNLQLLEDFLHSCTGGLIPLLREPQKYSGRSFLQISQGVAPSVQACLIPYLQIVFQAHNSRHARKQAVFFLMLDAPLQPQQGF